MILKKKILNPILKSLKNSLKAYIKDFTVTPFPQKTLHFRLNSKKSSNLQ